MISGAVKKLNDTTFRFSACEAGWDNPRRSFTIRLVPVTGADREYKGTVQPLRIQLSKDIYSRIL